MPPHKPIGHSLTLHKWIIESIPSTHTHCSHPLAFTNQPFPVESLSRDQVWNRILTNEFGTTRGCRNLYWFPSHRARGVLYPPGNGTSSKPDGDVHLTLLPWASVIFSLFLAARASLLRACHLLIFTLHLPWKLSFNLGSEISWVIDTLMYISGTVFTLWGARLHIVIKAFISLLEDLDIRRQERDGFGDRNIS